MEFVSSRDVNGDNMVISWMIHRSHRGTDQRRH